MYVTYIITYNIYIQLFIYICHEPNGWPMKSWLKNQLGRTWEPGNNPPNDEIALHSSWELRTVKSGSPSGQSGELVTFLCDKGGMSNCVGLFGKSNNVDSQQSPTKSVVFVQTYSQFHILTSIIMHSSCCAVESLMLDGFDL